ncbi:histidine phosphatase family protein [Chloroflexota bacterium]
MSRLLLVRHGDTKLNSAQRFWGHTDIELSADGTKQAEQLRDRLAVEKVDTIYASNLSRAIATAEIIAFKHRLPVVTRAELKEINFGWAEGLTFDEISKQFPDLAKLMADRRAHPQFPGGESFDELNERVKIFLPELDKHAPEETILIVAHSAILRLLICHLLEIGIDHWRQIRIDLASLSILETYPQGAILNLLNDVSHLRRKR